MKAILSPFWNKRLHRFTYADFGPIWNALTSEEFKVDEREKIYQVVSAAYATQKEVRICMLRSLKREAELSSKIVEIWERLNPSLNFSSSSAIKYENLILIKRA